MASVEPRTRKDKDDNAYTVYMVRWRDPDGRQRARSFEKLKDARKHKANVEADLVRGEYIDPDAGKETFEAYTTRWLESQTFDSLDLVSSRLRLHVFPVLGSKQLGRIRPSTIQAWLRTLSGLAPNYQKVIFEHVASVFAAAVDDEALAKNPCLAASVRRPKAETKKIVPWTGERVLAVRSAMSDRYAIVATLGAGLGLRQGEIFGLSPDDLDFLRGGVEVQRQVRVVNGTRLVFAQPKGRKVRTVPLPDSVRDELAAYLVRFPAVPVTLPWRTLDGPPLTVRLVLTTPRAGQRAINRKNFNANVWHPALVTADVPRSRENGCHALRHFYASTLLDAGETIKAVSEYLGHSDPGFTLRTYTHLLPASHDRTRKAVDSALLGVQDVYTGGFEPGFQA